MDDGIKTSIVAGIMGAGFSATAIAGGIRGKVMLGTGAGATSGLTTSII